MLKETYFTPESIRDKAEEMLQYTRQFGRKAAPSFNSDKTALLALDLQSYFLNETSHAFIPSAAAILPCVNSLIRAFVRRGLPVFLSQHLNTTRDAGLMASWWHDLLTEENPMSTIDPRVDKTGCIPFRKTQYDAFFDTPLESWLREKSVARIVICGVMTHLCCETTARSAFMRGFEVFFTVDGTAAYNEAFARAALLNLAHGFAVNMMVQDILSVLESRNGG